MTDNPTPLPDVKALAEQFVNEWSQSGAFDLAPSCNEMIEEVAKFITKYGDSRAEEMRERAAKLGDEFREQAQTKIDTLDPRNNFGTKAWRNQKVFGKVLSRRIRSIPINEDK